MKYISTLLIFISASASIHAQSELTNKTWKVREFSSIFKNNKIILFNKDSIINSFDYSKLLMTFFQDGTYKGTNLSDTTPKFGTWSINSKRDSTTIDSVNFLLIKLDSTSFITRGYSLQLADDAGTLDTAYTYFSLYSSLAGSGSLPVELTSFTGQLVQNVARLNWSTATEINNRQFDIEASHNGVLFEKIGTVPGSINSASPLNYTFDDLNFFKPGKNYYRLKQVDLDGNYKFSPIVVVSVDKTTESSISIHPNPATNRIVLGISQPIGNNNQLQLTDITGRQVFSRMVQGNSNSIPVTLPPLAKGLYIVTIVNDKGEKLLTDKLIIQ